eukprot:CAMPEP_0197823924 /NCGR_PEP_ID=MMETSP1437-20131217/1240_1 /TAXON_ID=49252 ORGANISM="Eucampia antarctica, Strain CCMP1452" /NCGR_SAMPLE_ID=MMETSP1437 /ASSEMBLY_ACC=CAM_ASM_001096 /LENGTH=189 /DNA_ID=CAMNT_0043423337 /DNA_START=109 /DNA_END=675 /DNA_ORIENTATION=+
MLNNMFVALIASLVIGVSSLSTSPTRREALFGIAAVAASPTIGFFEPPAANAADDYQDGPRGLKYLVTNEGYGAKPVRGQKIKTSYTLYLNDWPESGGKKIDSSKGLLGDKPFEFNVGVSMVVKGWDLALLDMKEGESRRLIIPSDLGYGDQGAGGSIGGIPGSATLYFQVTLTELGKFPTNNAEQTEW